MSMSVLPGTTELTVEAGCGVDKLAGDELVERSRAAHARFVPTWFVGTPFDRTEEQLQYVSFLPHQDEAEELLRVVGGCGHATPHAASARKKISLQDYNRVTAKDYNKATAKHYTATAKDYKATSKDYKATAKDYIATAKDYKATAKDYKATAKDYKATAKDYKATAEDYNKVTTKANNKDTNSQDGREHKMLDDSRQRGEVAVRREHRSPVPDCGISSPRPHPHKKRKLSPPEKAGDAGAAVAAKALPQLLSPTLPSSRRRNSLPDLLSPLLPPSLPVAALAKPATASRSPTRSPRPRQRHVIALKYGKKNRKRVEALLKFAPRPKKMVPSSDNSDSRNPKDCQAPATAATPIIKEPANASSARKSVHTTPKKDFKSTAMRRVESVEGADPSTPVDKGRGSTPSSAGGAALASRKTSPGPTSAFHPSHEDRHTWHEVYQTYFELGRAIKHNATDDHKRGSPAYAVGLVEALLAFMISNAARTLSRPTADIWASITEYFNFVLSGTDDFRSLHGLVMQLGAVCRQQIQKDRMDRLARDPLPEEYVGSAPTPGSDGTTKTAEDGERYKNEYVRNKNTMIRNARELDVLWLEGSKRLSPELLKNDYPKTWQARRLDYEHRTRDRPTPALLPKGYFLPLDAATTPFEAVRYGLAFLTEWADVHSLHWQPRIDLDYPDRTVLKFR
ncbi:hypothetical protein DV736_g3909, partial [Chaetothyriales sp. CBS 134916]